MEAGGVSLAQLDPNFNGGGICSNLDYLSSLVGPYSYKRVQRCLSRKVGAGNNLADGRDPNSTVSRSCTNFKKWRGNADSTLSLYPTSPRIQQKLSLELVKDGRIGVCVMRRIRCSTAPQSDHNSVRHFAATSLYLSC